MTAGGYEVSPLVYPTAGAPAGPLPARRLRWVIAIFAAAAMVGVTSAAAFYLVMNKVSPVVAPEPAVAQASPATAEPPPVTTQAPAVATQAPPMTAEPPPVPVQPPPDTGSAGAGSSAIPGEPPAQEDSPATQGDTPTESTPARKKARGTLRVQTTPWAWVTIGKQKRQTPGAEFKLAPGYYTVRLEFPTLGITEKKKVSIESRKTFTLNIDQEVEDLDKEVVEDPKEVETPDKGEAEAAEEEGEE